MTVEEARRRVEHLAWANGRVLEALRRAESDAGRGLFAHVLATERVWRTRIRTGDSHGLAVWPELTLEECAALMRENVREYRGLLDGWSDADLRVKAAYENSSGTEFETPVAEILTHVCLHGSHHRGQINVRLRDAGDEPVNVDFITFVRARPAAEEAGV